MSTPEGARGVARLAYRAQQASLETQHQQLADQQNANSKQAAVLDLQAQELRSSRARVEREQKEQCRAQAKQVVITINRDELMGGFPEDVRPREGSSHWLMRAKVTNTSRLPIYDLHIAWHKGTAPLDKADAHDSLLPGAQVTSDRTVELAVNKKMPINSDLIGAVVFFYGRVW